MFKSLRTVKTADVVRKTPYRRDTCWSSVATSRTALHWCQVLYWSPLRHAGWYCVLFSQLPQQICSHSVWTHGQPSHHTEALQPARWTTITFYNNYGNTLKLKIKKKSYFKEKPTTHLNLTWTDIELLKNVDKKSLHLIPGVDWVGAIQNNHYVHVRLTSCKTFKDEKHQRGKQMFLNEKIMTCCDFAFSINNIQS